VNAAQHILVFGARLYRLTMSPFLAALCSPLGLGCRFTPPAPNTGWKRCNGTAPSGELDYARGASAAVIRGAVGGMIPSRRRRVPNFKSRIAKQAPRQ
jgi:hypothetical protein